jgi:proteasome lid subunit RPN8/RPN11
MVAIEPSPFAIMTRHAEQAYPRECCGLMLGSEDGASRRVTQALPLENAYQGPQEDRYEIAPEDLFRAGRAARAASLTVIGVYHSHPDCAAYFSKTDLENACPWYSFVVLSVLTGKFDQAACFRPNADLTLAEPEAMQVLQNLEVVTDGHP